MIVIHQSIDGPMQEIVIVVKPEHVIGYKIFQFVSEPEWWRTIYILSNGKEILASTKHTRMHYAFDDAALTMMRGKNEKGA